MAGLNYLRRTSVEFMWKLKIYFKNNNVLLCFFTPIQNYINIIILVGKTRLAKFN